MNAKLAIAAVAAIAGAALTLSLGSRLLERSRGAGAASTADLDALTELRQELAATREDLRLAQNRIGLLEEGLRERRRTDAAAAEEPGDAAARLASPAAARGADAAVAAAEDDPVVASLLEGAASERMRDFVSKVIAEERQTRRDEQARKLKERSQEFEELGKGPYGKHNFKVNSIGKKLGLSDYQKQHYHDLLVDYQERFAGLRKGVDWRDEAARERHSQGRQTLQDEFDVAFNQVLNAEQAQAYKDLPEFDRSAEGAAQVFVRATVGADGAGETVDVIEYDGPGSAPLPLPPVEVMVEKGVKVQTGAGDH
jgi:hypothetical protein